MPVCLDEIAGKLRPEKLRFSARLRRSPVRLRCRMYPATASAAAFSERNPPAADSIKCRMGSSLADLRVGRCRRAGRRGTDHPLHCLAQPRCRRAMRRRSRWHRDLPCKARGIAYGRNSRPADCCGPHCSKAHSDRCLSILLRSRSDSRTVHDSELAALAQAADPAAQFHMRYPCQLQSLDSDLTRSNRFRPARANQPRQRINRPRQRVPQCHPKRAASGRHQGERSPAPPTGAPRHLQLVDGHQLLEHQTMPFMFCC